MKNGMEVNIAMNHSHNEYKYCGIGVVIGAIGVLCSYIFQTPLIIATGVKLVTALRWMSGLVCGAGISVGLGIFVARTFIQNKLETSKSRVKIIVPENENSIEYAGYLINSYLNTEDTTAEFHTWLTDINSKLRSFDKKFNKLMNMIEQRFGASQLTLTRFQSPIVSTRNNLIFLVKDLIRKLEAFDEKECEDNIIMNAHKSGSSSLVEAYEGLQSEYITFLSDVQLAIESASIKIDELILEMSRMNDADLQECIDALSDLDKVIKDTQLYRK